MNIQEILNRVPPITEFLTVDEMDESTLALAKQYPDIVTVEQVGESTAHHPIYCMKLGKGKKKALMYGAPHPNEPIGCMMLEHLTKILCEDPALLEELDYTFYIMKATDVDGLRLNEGWLKGPFTYENYAMNFFRPNSPQQVEWTFPFHYKKYHFDATIPETKAIMKVMDEVKPDFVYSLHNSSFGGVYWYASKDLERITKRLPEAAANANLPLNMGEPEVPFARVFAPAVYEIPTLEQGYDFYEANLPIPVETVMSGGGSSADYMSKVNPDYYLMMCEEPYFLCPDCMDTTPCEGMTRREAIIEGHRLGSAIKKLTASHYEVLKKYAPSDDPYMLSLVMYTNDDESRFDGTIQLMEANPEEYNQPVTKASKFDNLIGHPWYSMLGLGVVRGSAKSILARTDLDDAARTEVQKVLDEATKTIQDECARINETNPCVSIDVRTLVQVQMQSALTVLEEL